MCSNDLPIGPSPEPGDLVDAWGVSVNHDRDPKPDVQSIELMEDNILAMKLGSATDESDKAIY